VLGLAALNLVLRRFRARMVRVAVNIEIARMDTDDHAADAAGLGIPTHMIANPEFARHGYSTQYLLRTAERLQVEYFASTMRAQSTGQDSTVPATDSCIGSRLAGLRRAPAIGTLLISKANAYHRW